MRSAWLALVAALLVVGVARAEPVAHEPLFSASIEYVAPPSCPSADKFETTVIERLGFDPFVPDAPNRVLVSIEKGPQNLEGHWEWRDEAGRWAGDRTFPAHTTDCAELVRAMGFALALQINLLAAGHRHDALGAGSSEPEGTKRAAPSADSSRPPASVVPGTTVATDRGGAPNAPAGDRRTPWVFGFGAGGSLGIGMSPKVIGLGRLFATAGRDPWCLELGGELSTQTVERRADGAGYRQQAWLVSAAACGRAAPFSLCLLAKAGALSVAGRTIDVPASANGRALQTGLRLAVRGRLGNRGFIAGRLEGLVNLIRWNVTLDQIPIWTAPTFASTLGVDVGVDF